MPPKLIGSGSGCSSTASAPESLLRRKEGISLRCRGGAARRSDGLLNQGSIQRRERLLETHLAMKSKAGLTMGIMTGSTSAFSTSTTDGIITGQRGEVCEVRRRGGRR